MDTSSHTLNQVDYLLEHLPVMLARQSDQMLQEQLGIGLSQYRILRAIHWHKEAEQRKLAQSVGQTEASISRQIKVLQQKGMVASEVRANERRKHFVYITPKGLKVAAAANDALVQYRLPIFSELNEKETRQLVDALIKLHYLVCQSNKTYACDHPLKI